MEIKEKKSGKANRSIPAAVRNVVWNHYIGEEKGKAKCFCCKSTDITRGEYECGHVIAHSKGGATTVENLRPICGLCNKSMGNKDMLEFMKEYGFDVITSNMDGLTESMNKVHISPPSTLAQLSTYNLSSIDLIRILGDSGLDNTTIGVIMAKLESYKAVTESQSTIKPSKPIKPKIEDKKPKVKVEEKPLIKPAVLNLFPILTGKNGDGITRTEEETNEHMKHYKNKELKFFCDCSDIYLPSNANKTKMIDSIKEKYKWLSVDTITKFVQEHKQHRYLTKHHPITIVDGKEETQFKGKISRFIRGLEELGGCQLHGDPKNTITGNCAPCKVGNCAKCFLTVEPNPFYIGQ